MANPLSPLVDDTGSVYETEGSSVGRTILGTEATTTIAQVIMKDGENLDQVFQEKVLSVILILKPRSSSLPLRHSSSLPSTSSSSSQVGQKTSGNKFIRREEGICRLKLFRSFSGLIKIFLHGEPQIAKREGWSRSVLGDFFPQKLTIQVLEAAKAGGQRGCSGQECRGKSPLEGNV